LRQVSCELSYIRILYFTLLYLPVMSQFSSACVSVCVCSWLSISPHHLLLLLTQFHAMSGRHWPTYHLPTCNALIAATAVSLPLCLPICLYVCLCACLSVSLSLNWGCLSVCLSLPLSACLSVCLSPSLPACLSMNWRVCQ